MCAHLIPIAISEGDGIGPEIMEATLNILSATSAPLKFLIVQLQQQPEGFLQK